MQTSNGYAILSCTSKQNVKAMGGRSPKSIFLMIYAFTSSCGTSTFSVIQAINIIADRMLPIIHIEHLF
ncbi:MAG: hypothetical protein JO327_09000 [Nitrososphaeraceae archaeon]|nr:hypothetical protein [Nitrososphaeraceae archaeon]MBV9668252.1 hypothetical protein [Nitrososphaeraceae archaeon]